MNATKSTSRIGAEWGNVDKYLPKVAEETRIYVGRFPYSIQYQEAFEASPQNPEEDEESRRQKRKREAGQRGGGSQPAPRTPTSPTTPLLETKTDDRGRGRAGGEPHHRKQTDNAGKLRKHWQPCDK